MPGASWARGQAPGQPPLPSGLTAFCFPSHRGPTCLLDLEDPEPPMCTSRRDPPSPAHPPPLSPPTQPPPQISAGPSGNPHFP